MSKIFGGSKSKSQQTSTSTSSNLAYQPIKTAFMPGATEAFQSGTNALTNELAGGFEGYKAKTGYDFWEKMGLNKVGGAFSGRGTFGSGATMKALANYQNQLGNSTYDQYLEQQAKLANLGLAGGNLLSGAGGVSSSQSQGTSSSKTYEGIAKTAGAIASAVAASDIRLKTNIDQIGEHEGLGIYQFHYKDGTGPFIGVMAQEVANLYPSALGPKTDDGFLTVDYQKLQDIVGEFDNDFVG